MAFTVYYSKKKIAEWKDKEEYKKALVYLEGVIKKHSQKAGFWAWFKNEQPLLDILDELKTLRVKQCIERAKNCMRDETDSLSKKDRSLDSKSLDFYGEARLLLEEAEAIQSTSHGRLLLKQAKTAVNTITKYVEADDYLIGKRLKSAQRCFGEIRDQHPEAQERLNKIETDLQTCKKLKLKISQDVSNRNFSSARKGLDEIFNLNREDDDYNKLLQGVQDKEQADELISDARKKAESEDIKALYEGLDDVNEAKRLDPKHPPIENLEKELKKNIAAIKYDEGVLFRDEKKDILKAVASFREIGRLGVRYKDASDVLKKITVTEKQIETLYDQGVSHGKNLEKAIGSFKKAQAFGFHYKDLDASLVKCEQHLKRCNELLSEAETLVRPDRKEYEKAIEKIQQALLVYPGYQKAKNLLNTAKKKKQLQGHLDKAKDYLKRKDYRFAEALQEVESALEIESDSDDAHTLKQEIEETTLGLLTGKLKKHREEKKVTTAIRLAKFVAERVPFTAKIEEELRELETLEAEARKAYQDGYARLNQARASEIKEESPRSQLYAEAEKLFRDALALNRDLQETVGSELETLENEMEEWRAYLEAWRLYDGREYQKCLNTLNPYKDNPLLKETSALIIDALNQLGFSGSFAIAAEGITYFTIPDDEVYVGRNTASFKQNHVALKLHDVSRKHGRITRLGGRYFYEDRDDCWHGTMISGKQIDRQIELKNGDILGYGFFKEDDGAATNESPSTCLKLTLYTSEGQPTLKITCEPSDHEDFCEDTKKVHILVGDVLTIGRGKGNTITLSDKSVSPEHLAISRDDNRYCIKDLGTPGGSFVNNEPVTEKKTLQLGDRIRIGNVEMIVEEAARG